MKDKAIFIQGLFAGILLCIVVYSGYLYLPGLLKDKQSQISFEQAIARIKNKEVAEVNIRQNSLEIVTKNKEVFSTSLDDNDEARDLIYSAAKDTTARITLEPASNFSLWNFLLNPSILIIIFGSLIIFTVIYLNHLNNKVEK